MKAATVSARVLEHSAHQPRKLSSAQQTFQTNSLVWKQVWKPLDKKQRVRPSVSDQDDYVTAFLLPWAERVQPRQKHSTNIKQTNKTLSRIWTIHKVIKPMHKHHWNDGLLVHTGVISVSWTGNCKVQSIGVLHQLPYLNKSPPRRFKCDGNMLSQSSARAALISTLATFKKNK